MKNATKKQVADVINALIGIRKNPELVDEFGGDFDFNTEEFISPNFKRDQGEKFDEVVNTLGKIVRDKYLDGISGNVSAIDDIKPDRENLKIKIIGSSTDKLERYLTDRLGYKVPKRNYKPIPMPISDGTKWEDIEIKFKDATNVTIKIGNETYDVDFEDMGFADMRKMKAGLMKPVESWKFLSLLSMQHGKFSLSEITPNKQKRKIEKQKQGLSSILKEYFTASVKGDPIEYDKENEAYYIKIKLIPEPTLREQREDRNLF